MSCCNNTYQLGCFNHCSAISFGTATGTATLTGIFSFAGINTAVNVPIVTGQPYIISLTSLNENTDFSLRLFNNDGSVHSITMGDTSYDCFGFKTMVVYNSTSTAPVVSECCTSMLIAVTGISQYTVTAAQWAGFGSVPSFEVISKVDGKWITTPIEPEFDQMPVPTSALIDIGGIPADTWYIKIKS